FGRTPPCAQTLIAQHPGRVVVGTEDPNPLVAGRGIALLRKAGIPVTTGTLAEECLRLNEIFFKYVQTGKPFVTLKLAQTLDGRIATATGDSRWVSSPASLAFGHRLRRQHDAILVGAGTVLADDPALTCRLVRGKNPLRIVVDSRLHTEPTARLFAPTPEAQTIVATVRGIAAKRRRLFTAQGVNVWEIGKDAKGHVDLQELLERLGQQEISSLLVEGGAGVATSLLEAGLADRLVVVLAPKIVGQGLNAIGDLEIKRMTEALLFRFRQIHRRGEDIILDVRPLPATESGAPPPGCRPGRS
ncbi:MAG: bifunctional diaminohydroxyphosphoribosylaminopyrimidine deaminase/5-amino-6-(5-phosphoribosylamino)uracil reductase RibD, partial [Syntrophaceae bacterium]|nr:bifunctional diaminohydroxyphosphoribosylaminopyrimidine deaminase/5-amino-6-(5-phosphoribosylamino)uracil reductase RibD [Syntrophaceae bacterium]